MSLFRYGVAYRVIGCFSCAFGSYFRDRTSYKNLLKRKNLVFFKKNLDFYSPESKKNDVHFTLAWNALRGPTAVRMTSSSVFRDGYSFDFDRLLGAIAIRADDVVVVEQESFADERRVAFVARETAAVPVTTFERHVTSAFRAET